MRLPRSLQARLGLSLGILLTLLWIVAASVTATILRHKMDEVFDSTLQETAQRLLPLAVVDIIGREVEGVTQRLGSIHEHDAFFTYIVRDTQGRILVQSHGADPAIFPVYDGPGFRQTATHRLYNEEALQGSIRISVAEPLSQRAEVSFQIQMVLGLPILFVIPLALLTIFFAVRASLGPLRRFRSRLAVRGGSDLSPVDIHDLPGELSPFAETLNGVLGRLKAAFEAERSFAANAAHEFRTPLAGAIAQAQRLQVETKDENAAQRAADIEGSLKRLTRIVEGLLQLARAEGGRLRLDDTSDLRIVLRLIVEDFQRAMPASQIRVMVPSQPVLSDLDPDAFGIICRNLIENALRYGAPKSPIDVILAPDGTFRVANDGPVIAADMLARLALRFEQSGNGHEGSGLGLAIVAALAERISSRLVLQSPRPGADAGFEAMVALPVPAQALAI